MAKKRHIFFCTDCGYESVKWLGKCPGCQNWNTFTEEVQIIEKGGRQEKVSLQAPIPIGEVKSTQEPRIYTHMDELNRVLGGGVVPGSLILVGGDPGIGKSTLLLQASCSLAEKGLRVLYVSGEESALQIKLRADRLAAVSPTLFVMCETNIEFIDEALEKMNPDILIIDSIQTTYHPQITSAPGSVSQVRECTVHCMKISKKKGIATVLVGHVTKEGAIAGPRLLEHMVDCVLYFEGERHHTYRLLRAVKNRFGSTNEIGLFEMTQQGLQEVTNPSEMFLSERSRSVAGSVVAASMEGTRPMLLEMQALVSSTHFPSPRRMAAGVDHHRLALIIAVLEKRLGMFLQNQDVYMNVAGGVKLEEPAVDLAIAMSIASSFRDVPIASTDVFIGEVGLTGEVRSVTRIEQRIMESKKLGFERVIVPEKNLKGWELPKDIKVIGVHSVSEALSIALK